MGQGHAHTQAFGCRVALQTNSRRPLGVDGNSTSDSMTAAMLMLGVSKAKSQLGACQVSSELFRIMLGTATLVLVTGDMRISKCVCVGTGQQAS